MVFASCSLRQALSKRRAGAIEARVVPTKD
jgi:hypothetical protein